MCATTVEQGEADARTILVVDDDDEIRFFVVVLLRTAGYTVLVASGGIEALDQVLLQAPDLIILDISMDGPDGLNVLRLVRANEPTAAVPVILLSAHAGERDIAQGREAGASDYITKPFVPADLLARVQSLLSSTLLSSALMSAA